MKMRRKNIRVEDDKAYIRPQHRLFPCVRIVKKVREKKIENKKMCATSLKQGEGEDQSETR